MTYFLDTDTLSWAYEGHKKVSRHIKEVGMKNVATTIVTVIEVLRGRYEALVKAANGEALLKAQRRLQLSQSFLPTIRMVSFDQRAADVFDAMRDNKTVKKIGRADLLIACIALANRTTVVTRNTKDFRLVPGLRVENWVD